MKIIKDKNNVVVFAGDDLDLTEKGLIGKNFTAPFCTTKDFTAEEVDDTPDDYAGGHYTYDGTWAKSAYGIEAEQKELAVKAAEQAKIGAEIAKAQAVEKAKEDIVTAKRP